jgi:hypothetical protein
VAYSGRISVLVSKELQTLLSAVRELPASVNKQIRIHTKPVVEPVWQEAVRGHVVDRLQTRVLFDTARVAVADTQITLKAGGVGQLRRGVPNATLAKGVEFGADREFVRTVTNRRGTRFERHTKRQFHLPRSRGYVVYPAARTVIPRLVSLWVQTAVRTIHELIEAAGK